MKLSRAASEADTHHVWQDENRQNPLIHSFQIVPSDVTDIALTRAIYVGGVGDLAVLDPVTDVAVVWRGLIPGLYPIVTYRVMATGTTATLLHGAA